MANRHRLRSRIARKSCTCCMPRRFNLKVQWPQLQTLIAGSSKLTNLWRVSRSVCSWKLSASRLSGKSWPGSSLTRPKSTLTTRELCHSLRALILLKNTHLWKSTPPYKRKIWRRVLMEAFAKMSPQNLPRAQNTTCLSRSIQLMVKRPLSAWIRKSITTWIPA